MDANNLYQQISQRTDGSVYIGVVGPVRTGKSTFIKRFMEQLVLPNIENVYRRERAKDELPQSGSGRKEQAKSKAAIRNCTHSFAQRVQHQPCRGGQWQVKGAALAVLGDRKGAILPPRMAPFHAAKGSKSMTSPRR